MTVDPTDPETFEDEVQEAEEFERAKRRRDADGEARAERKETIARRGADDPAKPGHDPGRANEADLAEQARIVSHDEDDYR
ncbi:hypothetical protein [Streptomyces sp. DHE17-7]|uniref:hypothetical protein n=1 Tax=Streptomyces sp. DHE17-7 TaxID=2759949 RepID=UPI0022EA2CAE|nr:hypothetical protein [Streptomyces sp. DHE17-7]MBJ6621352.1 hypothetical protein [Streptomyces sp. DHE17-7]